MNCEQVEELLSAYLDDTLAVGERVESAHQLKLQIEIHLANCIQCRTLLADFRHFDALLAQMPRVTPNRGLRDRIFSDPEYLELTGTYDTATDNFDKEQTVPAKRVRPATPGRPQLVALPGGRSTSLPHSTAHSSMPMQRRSEGRYAAQKPGGAWALWVMQTAIVAAILLTLGVGSLIGWNIWLQKNAVLTDNKAITPPSGPAGNVPLPAGMHFVFLRDGSLWSGSADGSMHAIQLTPKGTAVATNWVVSPPLSGRDAGDMLAYIDLQHALVHTIRSDGQRDTAIQQPLLKAGIAPSSVWDTELGEAILNSLSWSKDGSMLAFVADPAGTGSANLYILSTNTGTVQPVSLPVKGSVAHPVWSPDGIRIAFEVSQNSTTSILDYNTQNHGVLVITSNVTTEAQANDRVLMLDWAPSTDIPAITWSVGVNGHVHSIWLRYVGDSVAPQAIVRGDYMQAIYSRNGHGGVGSWLLIASAAGQTANILRLDAMVSAFPVTLTNGKHVGFAEWSPDGTQIDYLDSITAGVGAFHVVNVTTAADTFISTKVTNEPVPAWSKDGQMLAYSTGTQTIVVNVQDGKKTQPLQLHGQASAFVWSATSSQQLVVALSDGQSGIYLVDTQRNTAFQVDAEAVNGPILWTEIP